MILLKKLLPLILLISYTACNKSDDTGGGTTPPTPTAPIFAKGADISWLTQMEGAGRKFYTSAGAEQEGMLLLKNLGMNSVRLRVWVNPSGGWNNTADVVAKAVRALISGIRPPVSQRNLFFPVTRSVP